VGRVIGGNRLRNEMPSPQTGRLCDLHVEEKEKKDRQLAEENSGVMRKRETPGQKYLQL